MSEKKDEWADYLSQISGDIEGIIQRISVVDPHRCVSIAITRLEEARLWIGERVSRGSSK